jgi:hypothetical protein
MGGGDSSDQYTGFSRRFRRLTQIRSAKISETFFTTDLVKIPETETVYIHDLGKALCFTIWL